MADGELHQISPAHPRGAPVLGLNIPEQAQPPSDSLLRDPRQVTDWIETLPMANIGETSKRLYQMLIDFNRFELSDLIRARLVEMFRRPFDYVSRNLYRHYVDTGMPLSPKSARIAALNRELNAELAVSYKITIERMLSGKAGKFDRRLLVISIHRALHYLGKVMLQSHLTYTDPPTGLWREVNRLFAYAAQNHVHRTPVKTRFEETEEVSTIEETYIALLLVKMASPNTLRQSQIQQLSTEALRWAAMVQTCTDREELARDEGFFVDLTSDQSAQFGHFDVRSAQPLFVEQKNLLKHLHELFDNYDPARCSLPRAVLKRLINAWTRPPQRRYVRTRLNFEFVLQAGLSSIYQTLATVSPPVKQEQSLPRPIDLMPHSRVGMPSPKDSLFTPDSLESSSFSFGNPPHPDTLTPDSFSLDSRFSIGANSLSIDPGDSQFASSVKQTNTSPVAPQKLMIQTLNESAGGYCVNWSSLANPPRIKVNDLIGVAASDADTQYTLCMVRWLHVGKKRQLRVGLQIISTQVSSALLRDYDNGNGFQSPPPVKALLLSGSEDSKKILPSLVLSNKQFNIGSQLWLVSQGQERLIRLTGLMESNKAFTRYAFSMESRVVKNNEDSGPEETNFDDLWSAL